MRSGALIVYLVIASVWLLGGLRCARDSSNATLSAGQIASWFTTRDHGASTNVRVALETSRPVDGRDDVAIIIVYNTDIDTTSLTNNMFDIVGVDQDSLPVTIPSWTVSADDARTVRVTFAASLPTRSVYRMRLQNVRGLNGQALSEVNNERILLRLKGDLDFDGISLEGFDTSQLTVLIVGGATVNDGLDAIQGDLSYNGIVQFTDIAPFTADPATDLTNINPPSL